MLQPEPFLAQENTPLPSRSALRKVRIGPSTLCQMMCGRCVKLVLLPGKGDYKLPVLKPRTPLIQLMFILPCTQSRFPTMSDLLTSISTLSEAITTTAPKWKVFCIFNGTKLDLAKDVRKVERELLTHSGYHDRATLESIHGLFETCLELMSQYCLNPTTQEYCEASMSLQGWLNMIQCSPNGPPKQEFDISQTQRPQRPQTTDALMRIYEPLKRKN